METRTEIIDEIMRHMPSSAEYYLSDLESVGFVLSIWWKLNNDADRPNKQSKTIALNISRELLDDFPNYSESMQESALSKLGDFISSKLSKFDPDHQVPRYQQPPTEQWTVPFSELFI